MLFRDRTINFVDQWIYFLVFLLSLALIHSAQLIISTMITFGVARDLNLIKLFVFTFSLWFSWLLLIPMIVNLSKRHPISTTLRFMGYVRYILYSFAMTSIHFAFYIYLKNILFESVFSKVAFIRSYRLSFVYSEWPYVDFLVFWGIVGLINVVHYIQTIREKERINLIQSETISIAKLNALKSQIHPHFMFNTLNSISTLVLKGNQKQTSKMISLLGDLLRESIDSSGVEMTSLEDELAFNRLYLDIEKIRFGDHLTIEYVIDDNCLEIEIPHLILQAIIENAIKHGISSIDTVGKIKIFAKQLEDQLIISISDNGECMPLPYQRSEYSGIGIENTIARLKAIYKNDASLELIKSNMGGLCAKLKFKI